ncbi:unknown [Fusobacterium sp. CAG:439]|nr:unknown [Fusobacterium sp. CAG:439]
MQKVKFKKTPYIIRLMHEASTIGTYRVSKEIFFLLQKNSNPASRLDKNLKK